MMQHGNMVGGIPVEFVRKPRDLHEDAQDRNVNALRPLFISMGTVAKASGSAYVEVGSCKVLCSVYGPRPDSKADFVSETGRITCNVKIAPFAGVQGAADKERALPLLMKPALDPAVVLSRFPKSVVEIHVLVLEAEGDITSSAITCASLALADAEIEMFDLVAACSVAVLTHGSSSEMRVDPPSRDSATQTGSIMSAMMPSRGEVTQVSHIGEWSLDQFEEAMDLSIEACKHIHTLMRRALVDAATASLQEQTAEQQPK